MPIKANYQRPKIVAGDLRTPVTFFEYKPTNGPDPSDEEKKEIYSCTCLAYNPSMKDREILDVVGTKEAITIKIRSPYTSYLANNKHKAVLNDYRYVGKIWDIVDVAPDLENNEFVKIILGLSS